eukprot:2102332-Rhodomonas_salina.2
MALRPAATTITRICYAMSGTDVQTFKVWSYALLLLPPGVSAMQCPVLTYGPSRYGPTPWFCPTNVGFSVLA